MGTSLVRIHNIAPFVLLAGGSGRVASRGDDMTRYLSCHLFGPLPPCPPGVGGE